MTGGRQDGWTLDEDTLLAEVVLRQIRNGSTQLKGFEEAGALLDRTSAACGFRWNSSVRHQYKDAIKLAKENKHSIKSVEKRAPIRREFIARRPNRYNRQISTSNQNIDLAHCIEFLQNLQTKLDKTPIDKTLELLEKNQFLQSQLNSLCHEKNEIEAKLKELSADYDAILLFFEKARKLALQETPAEQKQRFQMDINGNLERI